MVGGEGAGLGGRPQGQASGAGQGGMCPASCYAGGGVCKSATRLPPNLSISSSSRPCPCSTQSELVVPVLHPVTGETVAVLDCDSDAPAAFDEEDCKQLEALAAWLAAKCFGAPVN